MKILKNFRFNHKTIRDFFFFARRCQNVNTKGFIEFNLILKVNFCADKLKNKAQNVGKI